MFGHDDYIYIYEYAKNIRISLITVLTVRSGGS